jgi:flavin-dependent dehydrogenase
MDEGLRLFDGSRVCIVGGGPAGSFSALHLSRLAAVRGLHLQIHIFEPRDFRFPGPAGCNRCAGILSSRLLRGLETLGVDLPPEVIQNELHTYALHLNGETVHVHQPDMSRRIVSIYRGGGPKQGASKPPASFDAFLLQQATARGAIHISHRARRVAWEDDHPVVYAGDERYPADLLILATGVNSRPPLAADFGYLRPKTAVMAQDEILLPEGWQPGEVQAYFLSPSWLTFGALIPKGHYLNISLLGKHIPENGVREFLWAIGMMEHKSLPTAFSLCGCRPRIVVGPARRFYGHRWVAVGDAVVTRLYKDGIGSAFFTARSAMEAAVIHGISRGSFHRHYAPYCWRIAYDNVYGKLLFALWHYTVHWPILTRAWMRAIRAEQKLAEPQHLHERILWGMFTGDEPYRSLFRLAIHLRAVWPVMKELLKGGSR